MNSSASDLSLMSDFFKQIFLIFYGLHMAFDYRADYLTALGIEQWHLRQEAASHFNITANNSAALALANHSSDNKPNSQTCNNTNNINNPKNKFDIFSKLERTVAQCTLCPLHETRRQTVFGSGNFNADIMFIGEAPGAEEDRQGKPFVGRAGQLLTQMLEAVGLSRDAVFIANILKCRPPQNRDPLPGEAAQCTPYLIKQINLIQPELLVALGRIAAQYLLNTKTPLSKLRGQVYNYQEIPLLVTYHPAYLLRSPLEKAKAFEDLKKIKLLYRN